MEIIIGYGKVERFLFGLLYLILEKFLLAV